MYKIERSMPNKLGMNRNYVTQKNVAKVKHNPWTVVNLLSNYIFSNVDSNVFVF